MNEVASPAIAEPNEWNILFHTKSKSRLLSILACGRFKHVSAFAYYPGFKVWLLYDAQWSGLSLSLIDHDAFCRIIGEYTEGCVWMTFTRRRAPLPLYARFGGIYCVPAIKHLLSLRSRALRPDGLYRHLLRHGGTIINERGSPAAPAG